jgi:hypothetical protein
MADIGAEPYPADWWIYRYAELRGYVDDVGENDLAAIFFMICLR